MCLDAAHRLMEIAMKDIGMVLSGDPVDEIDDLDQILEIRIALDRCCEAAEKLLQ